MHGSGGLGIIKYNSKILCKGNLIAGLLYALSLPLIFSFDLLLPREAATVSEIPMSLLGGLLFTALTEVDFDDGVGEIVSAKRTGKGKILLYRSGIGILLLGGITGALLLYMRWRESVFDFGLLYGGALINQFFLGMVGMTAANLLHNAVAGYLTSFSYFFMEFMTKGKYTGALYLFSLTNDRFTAKWWLLAAGVILVLINVLYFQRRNLR